MLSIVPLAINMVIGPQLITSILLLPSKNRFTASVAYITSVAFASFTGILCFYMFSDYFNLNSFENEPSKLIKYIQIGICILLVILSLKAFLTRKTSKEPVWMKKIQNISPLGASKLGIFLIYFMPADILSMLAIALHWSNHLIDFFDIISFTLLITVFVSTPLLSLLIFKENFLKQLPKIQRWIDSNSWVISIGCYLIFFLIVLFSY